MSTQQLTSFILNPTLPMPKVFPDPRTPEDDRDIQDLALYVATWPP